MKGALDTFELEGIGHNIPFLQAVYDHPRFESGNITTAFIAEEYPDGFTGAPARDDYAVSIHGEDGMRTIVLREGGEQVAAKEVLTSWKPGEPLVRAAVDNEALNFKSERTAQGFFVRHRGVEFDVKVRSPRAAELAKLMPVKIAPDTSNLLLCPMPGVIVSVMVSEGDEVQDGQALAVVEAMKMENTLRAETKGIIAKINCAAGDNLAVDDVIMEFET